MLLEIFKLKCITSYLIKNLDRVYGESLELWHTSANIRGHMWHMLSQFFHGQLTNLPLENYSPLHVAVCNNQCTAYSASLTEHGSYWCPQLESVWRYISMKRHGQHPRHVCGITVRHCSATDNAAEFLYDVILFGMYVGLACIPK